MLSAYAHTFNHPLDWGAGGPPRWPTARPYYTPPGCQDHLGINIYEWYSDVIEKELGKKPSIFLYGSGSQLPGLSSPLPPNELLSLHTEQNLTLFNSFYSPKESSKADQARAEVLAVHFDIFPASGAQYSNDRAWFSPDGTNLPIVNRLQEWIAHQEKYLEGLCPQSPAVQPVEGETEPTQPGLQKVFDHYLLLPLYAWGVADWDLDSVRRIILDEHPTVGFTLEEARLAKRVTVFEAKPGSMHEVARNLSKAGCDVELIDSSGTRIASMDDREIRL